MHIRKKEDDVGEAESAILNYLVESSAFLLYTSVGATRYT